MRTIRGQSHTKPGNPCLIKFSSGSPSPDNNAQTSHVISDLCRQSHASARTLAGIEHILSSSTPWLAICWCSDCSSEYPLLREQSATDSAAVYFCLLSSHKLGQTFCSTKRPRCRPLLGATFHPSHWTPKNGHCVSRCVKVPKTVPIISRHF